MEAGVKFLFIDICESVGTLKKFLAIRDVSPAFAEVREKHRAGVPALVVDDEVILVDGPEQIPQLVEQYKLLEA